jgi:hypothetical protein
MWQTLHRQITFNTWLELEENTNIIKTAIFNECIQHAQSKRILHQKEFKEQNL